ncbi:MAG: restriction endonuclease subunit S [Flavobacteriaceae bacterium]|nr:restriction endonuclease subunit S [Flavobacteriaceae bacterium]
MLEVKNNNIPKLRFPEFKGEWKKKKLGEVLKIGSGKDYKHLGSGDIPVFGTGGLMTKVNSYLYDGETVCIGRKGTIDKPMYYSGKIWTVDTLFYTHSFNNSEPKFVFNLFQRVNWKQHNEAGGVPSLSKSTIEQIYLNLPTLTEQTRIASFFTVIDKKISELKQKKALLEQYKKGVMQKLFSQELRFKDDTSTSLSAGNGKDFPDWEKKKLGEVCEIIMGQSPSSNSYNTDGIGIPLIQGNADIQNRLSYPRNWTTEKTKKCNIGDLILTVRAPVGAVAKSIHNACIGRGVCAIRNNSKSINEFIYQFLLDYETKWSSLEQGSTFTAVSGVEIKKLEIQLPSLPEQTKIANFLSTIDEKINCTQKQIEQAEVWKKGLLQQMFC